LDEEMRGHIVEEFCKKYPEKKIFVISAAANIGLSELKDFLVDEYTSELLKTQEDTQMHMKVFDLKDDEDAQRVAVTYEGNYTFKARGKRLEQIVRMTDFENLE